MPTSTARLCDADGVASASVEYTRDWPRQQSLAFCQHHARKHHDFLIAEGWDGPHPLFTDDDLVAAFSEPVPAPATGYTAEGSI